LALGVALRYLTVKMDKVLSTMMEKAFWANFGGKVVHKSDLMP